MAVVIEAVLSGQIRLYSNCHLAAWDASERELHALLEYLDTTGTETGREFEIGESSEHKKPVFVHTGVHDRLESHDAGA